MAFIILGLGNPGSEYVNTRHNAGRMAVERFAKEHDFPEFSLKRTAKAYVSEGSIAGEKVALVLPDVYMNHTGKVVPSFVKSVKAAKQLLIVRDDLDMPLGAMKMTMYGRGAGGHKGVESVMRAIKTKDFAQLKLGISSATPKGRLKKPAGEEKVVAHVIGKFKPADEPVLKKTLKRAADAMETFITSGIEAAMLEANTK